MSQPIRQAPSTPTRPAPHERPTPAPSDKRPAAGGMGRPVAQANRSALNSPMQEATANADGLLFSQLLVPPVDAEPDRQAFSGSQLNFALPAETLPSPLIDELAQRLPGQADGPFSFTLLMPTLGKVRVNANKADNRWNIDLGFARRDVFKRLHGHAGACRDALSQALGQDVELTLYEAPEA